MAIEKTTREKLGLAISLIVLGVLFIWNRTPSTVASDTFKNEPVKVQGFDTQNAEGDLPTRVVIPGLGIDLPVERAKIIDGYWEVFEDTAAWGEDSGLPGKPGNQVVFAHAREGLFLPLKDVSEGEVIYILTNSDWYSYKVAEIKEVLPNQTEVIAPTLDETLTLYTCSGFNDSKRLIVIAKRV